MEPQTLRHPCVGRVPEGSSAGTSNANTDEDTRAHSVMFKEILTLILKALEATGGILGSISSLILSRYSSAGPQQGNTHHSPPEFTHHDNTQSSLLMLVNVLRTIELILLHMQRLGIVRF